MPGHTDQRCARFSSNVSHFEDSFPSVTLQKHPTCWHKLLERFPERDRGFSRNVSHVLIENMIKAEKK